MTKPAERQTLENIAKAWIMKHVRIHKPTGCFLWQYAVATEYNRAKCGETNVKKYGLVSNQTSRAAYALWYPDKFDPSLLVLHTNACPKELAAQCVNPEHMHQGTHSDNGKERIEYGNGIVGSNHPRSIFTNKQARAIKRYHKQGMKGQEIAIRIGMSIPDRRKDPKKYDRIQSAIRGVINHWAHIKV